MVGADDGDAEVAGVAVLAGTHPLDDALHGDGAFVGVDEAVEFDLHALFQRFAGRGGVVGGVIAAAARERFGGLKGAADGPAARPAQSHAVVGQIAGPHFPAVRGRRVAFLFTRAGGDARHQNLNGGPLRNAPFLIFCFSHVSSPLPSAGALRRLVKNLIEIDRAALARARAARRRAINQRGLK